MANGTKPESDADIAKPSPDAAGGVPPLSPPPAPRAPCTIRRLPNGLFEFNGQTDNNVSAVWKQNLLSKLGNNLQLFAMRPPPSPPRRGKRKRRRDTMTNPTGLRKKRMDVLKNAYRLKIRCGNDVTALLYLIVECGYKNVVEVKDEAMKNSFLELLPENLRNDITIELEDPDYDSDDPYFKLSIPPKARESYKPKGLPRSPDTDEEIDPIVRRKYRVPREDSDPDDLDNDGKGFSSSDGSYEDVNTDDDGYYEDDDDEESSGDDNGNESG